MRLLFRSSFLFLLCAGALYGDGSTPDFFLVPIVPIESHGAFQTTWIARVSYRYDGDSPMSLSGETNLTQTLAPRSVGSLQVPIVDAPGFPGRFLYVPSDQSSALFAQEHVFEASIPAGGIGVPVVRAGAIARGRTVHLIGVPVSENSRTLVRIYDAAPDTLDADVRVTVTTLDGTSYSDLVHLGSPPISRNLHFPTVPIYAEYHPRVSASNVLFIDIQPMANPLLRLWAFATTTDNRTQAIVGVFPAD